MRRTFQRLSIGALILLFILSGSPDGFSKGARGFSRSSGRSYSGRSVSKSYNRTYSTPSRSGSTSSSSKLFGRQSSSKSYGKSATPSSQSDSLRRSSAVRQKQNAMSSAKTRSAVSTKGMTSSEKRALKAQQRTATRDLKAENRHLKRQVTLANRETARARRNAREASSPITINNFGSYYPNPGYSLFSLTASMVFANVISGIFFHDYYNHHINHSWLWHYHHPDYDRSHWSHERQMEYERWRAYYDSQAIQSNPNYVDPGANRDEDYIDAYVEKNTDQFYGPNAVEAVTVEELPNEGELREVVLSDAQAQPQKIMVQKKTSGGTWFLLIFGSVLILGVIALVMYNKGYF